MSAVADAVLRVDWPLTLSVPLDESDDVAVIEPPTKVLIVAFVVVELPITAPAIVASVARMFVKVPFIEKRLVDVALVNTASVAVRFATIAVTPRRKVLKKLVAVALVVIKLSADASMLERFVITPFEI